MPSTEILLFSIAELTLIRSAALLRVVAFAVLQQVHYPVSCSSTIESSSRFVNVMIALIRSY